MNATEQKAFEEIYASGSGGHGSGPGSSPDYTIEYRGFIQRFIRLNAVRNIVDIGCGDWQFSRFIDFSQVEYTGFDVVQSLIERNRSVYAAQGIAFEMMPECLDHVPGADLLIVKDVVQHLPDDQIFAFMRDIFPRFKFSLITNSYEKIDTAQNINIESGDFRCIDLTAKPYFLKGAYVFEYWAQPWERIRTLLVQNENLIGQGRGAI